MSTVAFATMSTLPNVGPDDQLAVAELERLGMTVEAAVWDDPAVNWSAFEAVVIRSTWDYHQKYQAFRQWIVDVAQVTHLWNPCAAVLENSDKRYLIDLAQRGVPCVPTRLVEAGSPCLLAELLAECGWAQAVVKPTVSAGARDTWRTSMATAEQDQSAWANQIRQRATLVQPYMPAIASSGEWSLLFFQRAYSHAVLKKPAAGDFRVQQHLGGSTVAREPPAWVIEQATAVVEQQPYPLLYARLDGIEHDGQFVLMELELIEPFLFLQYHPDGPRRFAHAIQQTIRVG